MSLEAFWAQGTNTQRGAGALWRTGVLHGNSGLWYSLDSQSVWCDIIQLIIKVLSPSFPKMLGEMWKTEETYRLFGMLSPQP